MKTLRNGYLCVKVAYLKSKPITVLINTVAHGRNRTKFDLVQSNQPQNSSISLPSAPLFILKNNFLFLEIFFLKFYLKIGLVSIIKNNTIGVDLIELLGKFE